MWPVIVGVSALAFSKFINKEKKLKKRIFISFAIEDIKYRNHLVEQAKKNHSPFDFIDMSVKKNGNKMNGKKDAETK